jgi:hypothetical protein
MPKITLRDSDGAVAIAQENWPVGLLRLIDSEAATPWKNSETRPQDSAVDSKTKRATRQLRAGASSTSQVIARLSSATMVFAATKQSEAHYAGCSISFAGSG